MKINILFPIKYTPSGGGNQFLRVLKKQLIAEGKYSEIRDADIVIFNSHQCVREVIKSKFKYPEKLFIHRIDGPMRLYNRMGDKRDLIVNLINEYIADGTVFQSEWSREENCRLGLKHTLFETIVHNCADSQMFNTVGRQYFDKNKKIKLIASSWSSNMKKGFPVYQYLDDNLDWSRYEMTFIGNSPVEFKNIMHIPPLNSSELSKWLKQSDIYLSASQKEACSNSIIEALSCGLPVICYNDGGNPELVKEGGVLFENQEDIPNLISTIVDNYDDIRDKIEVNSDSKVANQYIQFCQKIYMDVINEKYCPKKLTWLKALLIWNKVRYWQRG